MSTMRCCQEVSAHVRGLPSPNSMNLLTGRCREPSFRATMLVGGCGEQYRTAVGCAGAPSPQQRFSHRHPPLHLLSSSRHVQPPQRSLPPHAAMATESRTRSSAMVVWGPWRSCFRFKGTPAEEGDHVVACPKAMEVPLPFFHPSPFSVGFESKHVGADSSMILFSSMWPTVWSLFWL